MLKRGVERDDRKKQQEAILWRRKRKRRKKKRRENNMAIAKGYPRLLESRKDTKDFLPGPSEEHGQPTFGLVAPRIGGICHVV